MTSDHDFDWDPDQGPIWVSILAIGVVLVLFGLAIWGGRS